MAQDATLASRSENREFVSSRNIARPGAEPRETADMHGQKRKAVRYFSGCDAVIVDAPVNSRLVQDFDSAGRAAAAIGVRGDDKVEHRRAEFKPANRPACCSSRAGRLDFQPAVLG